MPRDTPNITLRGGGQLDRVLTRLSSSFVSGSNSPNLVEPFGVYPNLRAQYPNDVVQVNIFNAVDRYLESVYRFDGFTVQSNQVTVDVEQALTQLGYLSGKYRTEFRLLRNHLGSGDGNRLRVQEVSANGLEVRVVPVSLDNESAADFFSFFAGGFFQQPKPEVLPNLYLFKDAVTSIGVFDYVQDAFTFREFPYSIIFKLTVPSADTLRVGDLLWLAQEVSPSFEDTIVLTPPQLGNPPIQIGAPNWECLVDDQSHVTTDYKNWDDLLSTNPTTTQALVRQLFSGSLLEGIPLNCDFREFDNFVHFGSAEERLRNFHHKMGLLEYYDERLTLLNPTPAIPEASSSYSLNNILDARNKRNNILGSFDAYEEYLYYQSSSYESSSFGVWYPTTWPKSNNTTPYTNFSYTSSQVESWFVGIISSASAFDAQNPHTLAKTIPGHVHDDQVNQQYILLVNMIGHYFDILYGYIKGLTDIHDRNESLFEGFSKDLVYHVAQSLGVDFSNGNTLDDLWKYLLGTDQDGNLLSEYDGQTSDGTKEIWKRIVNNLPYLLKTKGTERGLRALINCFGIPQTILRIREFGGPEPSFENQTDWSYDKFSYSTIVGYNGATGGDVNQKISVPWVGMTENGGAFPRTIQLRVAMAPSQSKDQTILKLANDDIIVEAVNGDALRLTVNGSSVEVSSSIYDGTFHLLSITRDGTDTTLIAKKANYGKVVSTVSASVADVSTAISTLYVPSDVTVAANNSHSATIFTGSVQELRLWNSVLQERILDNHALAPTSFQGSDSDTYSGNTSSFADLAFRLTLGSNAHKVNYAATASVSSSHPNQGIAYFTNAVTYPKMGTFTNFAVSSSIPHVETYYQEWPDLGANRTVANKIRIDSTIVAGNNQLFHNSSVVRSLSDDNPPDSSRLGVYFSPTNEVDQDIAEQFGGLSIDDFIGDPSYYELVNYPGLEALKYQYTKKYGRRNNPQAYIRLLASFNSSLFQLIKKLVPYRANTQVGLVIEPTLLDRSKWPSQTPSYEQLHWSGSLSQLPDPDGFVQDGDGEPFRNMQDYVQAGVIEANGADYLILDGFVEDGDSEARRGTRDFVEEGVIDVDPILPEVEYDYVIFDETIHASPTATGDTDQYGRPLFNTTGSRIATQFGTAYDEINLRESQYGRDLAAFGSQYVFMSYATSGSGPTRSEPYLITSSRYDYHDPFNAIVMDGRRSEISNVADRPYSGDVFNGKAFARYIVENDQNQIALNINGKQQFDFTRYFGLRILRGTWAVAAEAVNRVITSGGLATNYPGTLGNVSGNYALLDSFFYEEDQPWTKELLYKVGFTNDEQDIVPSTASVWVLEYGQVGSTYRTEYLASQLNPSSSAEVVTKASGPFLVLNRALNGLSFIPKLTVECLNYRAPVQDFHLHDSYGMRNARYDGCKLTSADWNVDSQDTVDGGPVVLITQGGGTTLVTRPSARGTFEVQGTEQGIPTSTRTGTRTGLRRQ